MSDHVTLAQVLACAPPEWNDTEHGIRSMNCVHRFHGWYLTNQRRTSSRGAYPFWSLPALEVWTGWLRVDQGLSSASVNRYVAAVLSVWRRAHRRGLLDAPPTGMYSREPKGRRRVLSPEEEPKLLAALVEPYRSLAAFLLASGLRVGEALALEWLDLGREEGHFLGVTSIRVRDSKNGDARTVALGRDIFWECLRIDSERRGPFSGVSHSAFNHAFRAAKAAIGLEKDDELVPHSLRHTYATRMVVAGVPLSVVARLLGHRTVRTTQRYAHVSDDDAARWVKKVQEGA